MSQTRKANKASLLLGNSCNTVNSKPSVQFKWFFIANPHIKRHKMNKHYTVIVKMLYELNKKLSLAKFVSFNRSNNGETYTAYKTGPKIEPWIVPNPRSATLLLDYNTTTNQHPISRFECTFAAGYFNCCRKSKV